MMKNNIQEFLYDLEINTENLKAYNDMIEQQLQELDGDTSKIYALLKANDKEIQEIQNKATDLEHKLMEVNNDTSKKTKSQTK